MINLSQGPFNEWIGLRAHANGKHVGNRFSSGRPLVPGGNRFDWYPLIGDYLPDGSVRLAGLADGDWRAVTAEAGGRKSLYANRSPQAAGPWEQFLLTVR